MPEITIDLKEYLVYLNLVLRSSLCAYEMICILLECFAQLSPFHKPFESK
jgi:hypothetical protein